MGMTLKPGHWEYILLLFNIKEIFPHSHQGSPAGLPSLFNENCSEILCRTLKN